MQKPWRRQPSAPDDQPPKRRTQSSSAELQPSGPQRRQRLLAKDRYRIVVMGSAAVGKTCIISRLLYESFVSDYKATVEELHSGEYELDGRPLTLDILDTSGAYEFPAMRRLSISTGDAFILVYGVDDAASFEQVELLRDQIIAEKNGDARTPIVIVGNKTDLGGELRRVDQPTAETTASIDWGTGYVEVSAKDDVNISGIFRELLTQAHLQLEASNAAADDDDDGAPGGGTAAAAAPSPGAPVSELRRRRVGSVGSQRMRSKRTSCHVS